MLKNDYYIDYYIKVDSHIRIKMNSTRDQGLFANIVIEKKELHCKCHHWKEKTTLLVILDSELFSQEEVFVAPRCGGYHCCTIPLNKD